MNWPILRLVLLLALALVPRASIAAEPSSTEIIQRGETFLVKLLDPELNLLPEYHNAKIYWLFHDNYLAAKVLVPKQPEIASKIMKAIQDEGVTKSGKIEVIFGEVPHPPPFRHYQLKDVRQVGGKTIRTEVVQEEPLVGWDAYADLLLMASIAESDPAKAREHWLAALKFWDGQGFLDAAARHNHLYATYKLGLALIAAQHLTSAVEVPAGLREKLIALQGDLGGWITDYDAAGKRIGLANVETTCLAILGLDAAHRFPSHLK